MKKKLLAILLLFIALFNCDAVDELTDALDELTKFEVDYETTYTIPAVPIINFPVSLNTSDIDTENEVVYQNNKTNRNAVESISLKSMILEINTPESASFNFLKEIRIFIKSENVDETEIANLLSINNSSLRILELNTLDKELKPYLNSDSFTLRVMATADEMTTEEIDISIKSLFDVDAKILGI